MGKFSPKKQINHGVDEVAFKNHVSEFQRFYSNHKSFCDEVAGIKPRTIYEGGEYKQFFITKEKFIFAIRKLLAFVIDNLHYIKNVSDIREMEKNCRDLETDYLNDTEYHKLIHKNRSAEEEIRLSKMYLLYILRVYEIGNKLVNLLQNSLMIATSRVAKDVEYHNEASFFDELSKYRTELSDSISNYRFSDTLMQLKKIVGYYYTYKILLKAEEREFSDKILNMLVHEVLKEDVIRLIQKVADNNKLSPQEEKTMRIYHDGIKQALLKMYYITNKNLSERKILPKILRKQHYDKTLI